MRLASNHRKTCSKVAKHHIHGGTLCHCLTFANNAQPRQNQLVTDAPIQQLLSQILVCVGSMEEQSGVSWQERSITGTNMATGLDLANLPVKRYDAG